VQLPAQREHREPETAAGSGAGSRHVARARQLSKGFQSSVGPKHPLRLHAGFPARKRSDATQPEQRLAELGDWHNADQLGVAYERPSRGQVDVGKPVKARNAAIQRPICDRAERSKQAGAGVMDPQSGKIDQHPRWCPPGEKSSDDLADRP
jgi:hypothetical protein